MADSRPYPMPLIPASFFGIGLGLAGLANVQRAANRAWGLPAEIAEMIFAIAVLSWVAVVGLYALKWIVAPTFAREEASHAVQCRFVGLAGSQCC